MSNGRVLGAPSLSWNPTANRLDAFAVGTDSHVYTTYELAGAAIWAGWQPADGSLGGRAGSSTVSVSRRGDATMDLALQGADNALVPYHLHVDANSSPLGGWEPMSNGKVVGAPSLSWNPVVNRLDAFAIGTDSHTYVTSQASGATAWAGWRLADASLNGRAGSGIVGVSRRADATIDLALQGADNSLVPTTFTPTPTATPSAAGTPYPTAGCSVPRLWPGTRPPTASTLS